MNYCLRLASLVLLLIFLGLPHSAFAASSSAVTSSIFDQSDLAGKDFSGQNLQNTEFVKVKLNAVNLTNADLRGSIFNTAVLDNANLEGADLTNGFAYLTSFNKANLNNAIFTEALLLRSTFNGAKIEGTDFSYAILDSEQIAKLCVYASGVNPKTGVSTRESLGCK